MIFGYAFSGLDTIVVSVEVDISVTIPSLEVVGLPASEVKESRERVKTALRNTGYVWPNKKVLVNLAPSDVKKRGAGLDLPIALAILQETKQIPHIDFPIMAVGELQLNGVVRPVKNALPAVLCAVSESIRHFVVACENVTDVLSVQLSSVYAIRSLADIRSISENGWRHAQTVPQYQKSIFSDTEHSFCELSHCDSLKRVSQITATGRHAMLLYGVPGTGKTAAAVRLPTFLPRLSYEQSLEVSKIYACAGLLEHTNSTEHQSLQGKKDRVAEDGTVQHCLMKTPPVRQPHHSASVEAMVGSGVSHSIGEVSLAHHGVLLLDEAPEFKAKVLQALREPLDMQHIYISRVGGKFLYPADFLCVFTCNLCPCGNRGKLQTDTTEDVSVWGSSLCMCSEQDVFRYWKRIGGALWDRIDIKYKTEYRNTAQDDEPLHIRKQHIEQKQQQVVRALQRQRERNGCVRTAHTVPHATSNFVDSTCRYNGRCTADDIAYSFSFTRQAMQGITDVSHMNMSDRMRIAICRVSRTIADIDDDDMVRSHHVDEALTYTMRVPSP